MVEHAPFKKLLCANRGEIAIRVFRAATELGIRTVAVYSHEDRLHLHRYKADESYLIGQESTPVGAYLGIEEIIEVAKRTGAEAIHPGYGFLSERADLAEACKQAGIVFVGPPAEILRALGDKISARQMALECDIPVVPGSDGALNSVAEAGAFAAVHGYPLLLKASMGGGGRGMRVVQEGVELANAFEAASSEAAAAFGDGTLFIERYLENPRHIEVQILGDTHGHVTHLYERDCSVQRRHQKLLEMAPAVNLSEKTRTGVLDDAVKLCAKAGYYGAGTVEFLVDSKGNHYFIEVNPRIQVEHTVTEEVTGIDIVQAQIRIAAGATLEELDIRPENTGPRGFAIQCRVTTEDPELNFAPDTGRVQVYRSGSGMGIRLDGGSGYPGAQISPHYDPLLVKVTASGRDFTSTVAKIHRALSEFRLRGVKSNLPFLLKVLQHPRFLEGRIDTNFVDQTPELFDFPPRRNRAQKLLRYLGDRIVNGAVSGVAPGSAIPAEVAAPRAPAGVVPTGWRDVLLAEGPAGFAKAVRAHTPLLLTDTTWRDAHQSLIATRVRTKDLTAIAPHTAHALAKAFSLEMWGGATFDVALRFLHECPWDRLDELRALVPHIPFQMLLRGANAVGYTSYPDNVVVRFIEESVKHGMDVFRVFDSLNDLENLRFACDAVGAAGGVIEASLCYTGDVSDKSRTKYDLDYYLGVAQALVEGGIHILAIKDMAGLLKPQAARILVGALRREFPELPIHVHTHDTASTGVASMLAAAEAGADIVDAAMPTMAGLTSQPSMGAMIAGLEGTERQIETPRKALAEMESYWEGVRELYSPFESGLKSGTADVYEHEMPGGQYTNLKFQAQSLGLSGRWSAVKDAYAAANLVLGDVVKVTPTSKVVGDLAQFMVQNELDAESVVAQADQLSFPSSVSDFLRGSLGQPHGGFPEPFRSRVLGDSPRIVGRPGASLDPLDFDALRVALEAKHERPMRDVDLVSAALYPAVFDEFVIATEDHSDLSVLSTRLFFGRMEEGEEASIEIEQGKTLIVKFETLGQANERGERAVFFELNGQPRTISVIDRSLEGGAETREKADKSRPGCIGAPLSGVVTEVRVAVGDEVEVRTPLVVMSAMKMETVVAAPMPGRVKRVVVEANATLEAGDLIVEIELQDDA